MDEAWPVVMTASGMVNAKIITGRLEAEGIVTRLKYDIAGSLYAVTVDGLGAVDILVSAGDLARAREILAASYEDLDEGE
jgi:YD repeat-containing protein